MKAKTKQELAEHIAKHIENCHRGYEFPSTETLTEYIYCAIHDYELRNKE